MKRIPRKSARTAVEKLAQSTILKFQVCDPPNRGIFEIQLRVYREIAVEMQWSKLSEKIRKAVSDQSNFGTLRSEPISDQIEVGVIE